MINEVAVVAASENGNLMMDWGPDGDGCPAARQAARGAGTDMGQPSASFKLNLLRRFIAGACQIPPRVDRITMHPTVGTESTHCILEWTLAGDRVTTAAS